MVLIEAMACGAYVISSDCFSGPREIIGVELDENLTHPFFTSTGALTSVADLATLANAIKFVFSDEGSKLREANVGSGIERALRFDTKTIGANYINSMKRLVGDI